MKKMISLSLIACTLSFNHNTFSMLKHILRSQKNTRTYHAQRFFLKLPEKNIFNTPNPSQHDINGLLEDLYDRNNNMIRLLEEQEKIMSRQNKITLDHVFFEKPLRKESLARLEEKLQETFKKIVKTE